MSLLATQSEKVSVRGLPPRRRDLPLVEEPSFVQSQSRDYLDRKKRVPFASGPLDQQALYLRRIDNMKKTLEGMGTQPKRKLGFSREISPERSRDRREPTKMSRKSTLAPLKASQRASDRTLTGYSDMFNQQSIRSRDETLLSGPDRTTDDTWSFGTPAGIYTTKHTRKAFLKRKKRQGFLRTFPKISKFVCILISLWKKHQNKVKDFLETNVDLVSVDTINDLLFDKTDYTADKQARISSDTKRILSMLPEQRSPKDIKYVEVALRNYPSIAGYPVNIQTLIATRAWYEIYHGRRIIIRQGHVARCFYFILSGKAVITLMEEGASTSRTVCYLQKGDSFGEMAIINHTTRSATVISEGTVELLVVTDEDYEEIFTSGELTEKYYPFIRGLNYLKGWPIELLTNNPRKAYLTYFKRGAVMCENSNESDWIYVVKSGSLTVLKKLKAPQAESEKKKSKRKRKLETLNEEEHLSYLCNSLSKETRKLNRKEMAARHQRLRELHLGTHVTSGHVISTTPAKDPIDKVLMANNPPLSNTPNPTQAELASRARKLSGWQMGPMVTRTGITPLPPVDEARMSESRPVTGNLVISDVSSNPGRRISIDLQQVQEAEDEPKSSDAFVTVQTLVKGDSFGIAELIHGNQPEFSLVSNGAECIMIEKKLYWEHAIDSQPLMRRLKNDILPYPADEKMQADLVVTLSWDKHKEKVFKKALRLARMRKSLNKMKAKGMSVFVQR